MRLQEGFGDEDEGGGAVGERGGVGGGDGAGAVGDEGGAHGAEFFLVEGDGWFFVLVDRGGGGFALGARDFDGADFRFKGAGGGGLLGFLDGADGVGVLVGAGDGVVFGAFFGLEAHVLGAVGVGEAVFQEAVDEGVVAVFGGFAEGGEVVGDVGHGFGAAGDDAGGIAGHDCLGGDNDGFGARGADFVHGGADGVIAKAGIDCTLAGGILAETGRAEGELR